VTEAGPSLPVVVLGLSAAPNAGDELLAVESERKAREVALYRQGKFRDTKLAKQGPTKLEDMLSQMGDGKAATMQVVIKADVQGSAEALRDALSKLSTDEVAVKVVSSGVGGITESDVTLAMASNARIIGFNVRADGSARTMIKESGTDVRYYSIIYEAIDDVKQVLSGMLAPEVKEQIVGSRRCARCSAPASSARWRAASSRTATSAQQPDPRAARQRRDLRGRPRIAAALQGRRQ
jgi:translation initiation factor IF-2